MLNRITRISVLDSSIIICVSVSCSFWALLGFCAVFFLRSSAMHLKYLSYFNIFVKEVFFRKFNKFCCQKWRFQEISNVNITFQFTSLKIRYSELIVNNLCNHLEDVFTKENIGRFL